jgi:hypothetical protein
VGSCGIVLDSVFQVVVHQQRLEYENKDASFEVAFLFVRRELIIEKVCADGVTIYVLIHLNRFQFLRFNVQFGFELQVRFIRVHHFLVFPSCLLVLQIPDPTTEQARFPNQASLIQIFFEIKLQDIGHARFDFFLLLFHFFLDFADGEQLEFVFNFKDEPHLEEIGDSHEDDQNGVN